MTTWGDWIFVAGWCITKVLPAVGYGILRGMNAWEMGSAIFTGGSTGILIWAFFAGQIRTYFRRRRIRKKTTLPYSQRKLRRMRWLVRIRSRFGSAGIALITPPLISPIIGVPLTIFLKETLPKTIILHIISMAFWAIILASFGGQISQWIGN